MILKHKNVAPKLAESTYVAPGACVIGDVCIGADSSLWFNVVVRGDVNFIRIGSRTNIQDGSVVHVTRDTHPTVIGDDVSVGHSVTLHGCTIENGCLVGIGVSACSYGAFSCRSIGCTIRPKVCQPCSANVGEL